MNAKASLVNMERVKLVFEQMSATEGVHQCRLFHLNITYDIFESENTDRSMNVTPFGTTNHRSEGHESGQSKPRESRIGAPSRTTIDRKRENRELNAKRRHHLPPVGGAHFRTAKKDGPDKRKAQETMAGPYSSLEDDEPLKTGKN
jgi:hypothetical protein